MFLPSGSLAFLLHTHTHVMQISEVVDLWKDTCAYGFCGGVGGGGDLEGCRVRGLAMSENRKWKIPGWSAVVCDQVWTVARSERGREEGWSWRLDSCSNPLQTEQPKSHDSSRRPRAGLLQHAVWHVEDSMISSELLFTNKLLHHSSIENILGKHSTRFSRLRFNVRFYFCHSFRVGHGRVSLSSDSVEVLMCEKCREMFHGLILSEGISSDWSARAVCHRQKKEIQFLRSRDVAVKGIKHIHI